MGTLDYVVIMIGLFFIVESLGGDAFKSRRYDCGDEKKIMEIEVRVKKLEEKIIE